MGKRSVKKDKNIYQLSREEAELTREKASELMEYISSDRIEKIESERSCPHPDEILTMAKCYKKPQLANYFCSHECPIGQRYVPEAEIHDLPRIALEILNLNASVSKDRDRLIEIASNGKINDDEYEDFLSIQRKLEKLSVCVDELRIWLERMTLDGVVDIKALEKWQQIEQEHAHT